MLNDDDHRTMRDCKQSVTIRGVCDTCGAVPDVLHVPLRVHGWYCPAHCLACNRPGGAATVPSAPKVITGGKFAGSLIHELNDADLGEAHRACSRDDGPMQHAIAAERRRRWHAAHRARVLSRRRQSAQRRGGAAAKRGD
jgi:hypothetical protein